MRASRARGKQSERVRRFGCWLPVAGCLRRGSGASPRVWRYVIKGGRYRDSSYSEMQAFAENADATRNDSPRRLKLPNVFGWAQKLGRCSKSLGIRRVGWDVNPIYWTCDDELASRQCVVVHSLGGCPRHMQADVVAGRTGWLSWSTELSDCRDPSEQPREELKSGGLTAVPGDVGASSFLGQETRSSRCSAGAGNSTKHL